MSNNDIIPGFDDEKPRLDDSWMISERIRWEPIGVKLEKFDGYQNVIIVRLDGELEAFNGSYLASKLVLAIDKGIRCIYIDLERVRMGDYREVLVFTLLQKLLKENGILLLKSPPAELVDYWKVVVPFLFELENIHVIGTDEDAFKLINEFQTKEVIMHE